MKLRKELGSSETGTAGFCFVFLVLVESWVAASAFTRCDVDG